MKYVNDKTRLGTEEEENVIKSLIFVISCFFVVICFLNGVFRRFSVMLYFSGVLTCIAERLFTMLVFLYREK